jgi:energy-coupling factor transporter ATP-binding protein EcfA2
MIKLVSLTLEALRGATQAFELKFEAGKSISIIYGENGSGKSTVCDALDLLANESLGSLTGKGLSTTTKYWHSTNRKPVDIEVRLVATTSSWTSRVVKGKVVTIPFDTRPRVAILRRHQILDLIAKRAGERYETLRPFIAIETLDDSEGTLRKLINGTRTQLQIAAARIGENLQALEDMWKQAGAPTLSLLEWANVEAKRDVADLDKAIAAIQNFSKLRQELDSRTKDVEISAARIESAKATLSTAESELTNAVAGALEDGEELTQLLQAASHFFRRHEAPDVCPLCESPEFAASLPQKVETKLKSLSSVRDALRKRNDGQQAADRALSQSQTANRQAADSAETLCKACTKDWHADLPSPKPITDIAGKRGQSEPKADWSLAELRSLSQAAATLTQYLEPELGTRLQRRSQLQTVRDALSQYHHNTQQKAELDSLLPRLERAHEILMEERRNFVDNILGRIATRVGELYEEVHPGEGLNRISLQLDPVKRASLDVVSLFPGVTDSPPGAYLSESHLDTLGVCIFLALAELEAPEETILVLDDVIASVDEPHVDRIIEMLYDISQQFAHCILTTHYTPWKEKYRWGFLKKGECQFVELGEWTWTDGIVRSGSTPRVERLRTQLGETLPEVSEVCASAGVILEALLDFLTLQYGCAVPRRRTKPTLGDLLPNVNKKLRAVLRVEMHDTPIEPGTAASSVELGNILNKLDKLSQLRNIMGCHFNEMAFKLPATDGLEFGRLVLELADALIHPDHGWPGSDRSGEYWTNSGKSRRLYPLRQPS